MTEEKRFPVRLSEQEALLVSTMESVPMAIANARRDVAEPPFDMLLTLDEIADLVDALRDELVFSGFDENYALNQRGDILDGLADKLFARFLVSDLDQK